MNILILQASPRANGNTAWMAEEYKNAAEAAGHKVTLVNVSKKKIAGCLACEYCLPPFERIGGRMCESEVMEKEDEPCVK